MPALSLVQKADAMQQIVYGEVYAPNRPDSQGHMMLAEDIRLMCHRFMKDVVLSKSIDEMHNNEPAKAYPVESFIACADHPDGYTEGAWVVGVKVEDAAVWEKVLKGDYNGFSVQMLITRAAVLAEVIVMPQVFGETEADSDHTHLFMVQINEDGRVTGGMTAPGGADGHVHEIKRASATEDFAGHSHRFFV